jgi:hypothetical protein
MGQAKSLFTVWLADYAATRKGVNVLMLSGEDEPDTDLRPRFEALGADLDRIEIAPRNTTLHGLAPLCDEAGGARLVTVDPIAAFLDSRVNSWKGQDVRLALEPLRQLAADRNIAVVLIQHLNRRSDGDPLARIADSQGIPQLARSVMVWGPNPSDPEGDQGAMKVLTRAKCNLTRNSRESATFTVGTKQTTSGIVAPLLTRGEDIDMSADDVIADHEARTAQDEAVEWLRDYLADGPKPAKQARSAARAVGIADRTLDRAKGRLRAKSKSSRDLNGITEWTWERTDKDYLSYTNGVVGVVGDVGDLGKNAKSAKNVNVATYNQGDLL